MGLLRVSQGPALIYLHRPDRWSWRSESLWSILHAMTPSRSLTFEVCVDTAMGAKTAETAGAHRVELCANLLEGGTTPSAGSVAWVQDNLTIGVMVLIRPRGGDFVYSSAELEVMLRDIEAVKRAGVMGVVIGGLCPDGSLDLPAVRAMVEAARPMQITFHRAFDMCSDPDAALAQLIDLGVDRILTSGRKDAAADGLETLSRQVERAGDRISIMPGGGIFEHDIRRVVEESGAHEVHFAAAVTEESPMQFRNSECTMGCGSIPGEYDRVVTDEQRIRDYIRCGSGL